MKDVDEHQYRPGDIVNGHLLTADGWVPLRPKAQTDGQWAPGDVVNGHVFDGSGWLRVSTATKPGPAVPPKPSWWSRQTALVKTGVIAAGVAVGALLGTGVVAMAMYGASQGPYVPDGARALSGDWTIAADPERILAVSLDGHYEVVSDPSDAPAGMTDLYVEADGHVDVVNTSPDRDFKPPQSLFDWDGQYEVILYANLPTHHCTDEGAPLAEEYVGYCNVRVGEFRIEGEIEAGGSDRISISGRYRVGAIPAERADAAATAILGDDVVVTAEPGGSFSQWRFDQDTEGLNATCKIPRGGATVMYFFSEDPSFAPCDAYVGK